MSKSLQCLVKYFQAGTAEGDDAFLREVFIPFGDYTDIITVQPGNPKVLLGKKGIGKSAVLRFFKSQMDEVDIPVILLKPQDIEIQESANNSLGALTRIAEEAILKAIGLKLASNITGFVSDNKKKTLLKLANQEGEREPDFVESLLEFLAPIGKTITQIDFKKMVSGKNNIGVKKVKNAITGSLEGHENFFYVLIDDTDQIAAPDEAGQLNRIWAFLLAARSIMERVSNIRFIITLREEVWKRLKRDNAGQRDQVDHFRNLTYTMTMGPEGLKDIILRRLRKVMDDLHIKSQDPFSVFFDKLHVEINESTYRYWSDFIIKSSRERPRDAIQLIYKLAENAMKVGKDKIEASDVDRVMPIYSEERVDDLKVECEQECTNIKDIVRSFQHCDFDAKSFCLKSETAYRFIGKIPTRFSINLLGKVLQHTREDAFVLWRYLYDIGFINARASDIRESKGYKHICSQDDPELVSISRWDEMQKVTWEIHPAYRDYLIKLIKESKFNLGLP